MGKKIQQYSDAIFWRIEIVFSCLLGMLGIINVLHVGTAYTNNVTSSYICDVSGDLWYVFNFRVQCVHSDFPNQFPASSKPSH